MADGRLDGERLRDRPGGRSSRYRLPAVASTRLENDAALVASLYAQVAFSAAQGQDLKQVDTAC